MECIGLAFCLSNNEEVFPFRKTDFAAASVATFAEMRERGELCDFTITAGNVQISAHRLVLAANIPYFRVLFESNMKESLMRETEMKGVDPQALKSVIHFIYTGVLLITEANVVELLNISLYLQIEDVKEACLGFLSNRIFPGNALKIRVCAQFAENEEMVERVDRVVRENFAEVAVSEDFLDLPFSTLREIIRRDDLNVLNEEMVFESVMRWVSDSEDERIDYLPELLGYVRMELLAVDYLTSRVSSDELVLSSPLCKRTVDDVISLRSSKKQKTASCEIFSQERFCREKHHLKCAQQMGSGMYSVSLTKSVLSANYYDVFNKKWIPLCDLHNIRPDYAACIGFNCYFIGRSFLYVLNLQTMKCSFFDINNHAMNSGVTVHDSKIYFVGGVLRNLSRVQCFDPQTLSFSQVGKMTQNRICPGVASLGEDIYITGGGSFPSGGVLNSAEKFNPNSGRSSKISPMFGRRMGHASVAHNGRIYVCGGLVERSFTDTLTSSCEVYDPQTDRWTVILPMKTAKLCMSLLTLDKSLHVFDGRFRNGNRIEHEVYDESKGMWVREEHVDVPAHSLTTRVMVANSAVSLTEDF